MRKGLVYLIFVLLLAACGKDRPGLGVLRCEDCKAVEQPAYVWMNPEATALACAVPWDTEVELHSLKDARWLITVGNCSGFVSSSLVTVSFKPE